MAKIFAPPDPNTKFPPAVMAAAQRSNDLVAAATSQSNAPNNEGDPLPTFVSAPPPPPAPTQAPDWESRYKAMHGRFEQATGQVRSMSQQIGHMQNLIANMQATQAAPASKSDVRFVSEKEQEEYGSEFLDVVGKRTKEVVAPEIEGLRSELRFLKAQLGNVQTETVKSVREKMFDALTRSIPNWRQINEDQGFLDWLALPDPYSGDIRQTLLNDAYANNLTGRVEAFFKGYLAQEAATRPVETRSTRQSGMNESSPRLDLASLAAPGRAKQPGASNFAPEDKPIFTSAQIRTFYKEVSNGFYKGRDQERVAMEQAIFAAGSEGRIRN